MATSAQRLAALEAEVARLRQVVEARPAPDSDAKRFIAVSEAARLAQVSTQSVRNWIDRYGIGRFVDPAYLADRRLLREHLIRHRGKLPPELSRE
jgi:hypothetical protein